VPMGAARPESVDHTPLGYHPRNNTAVDKALVLL
jgi:hypothetical protein